MQNQQQAHGDIPIGYTYDSEGNLLTYKNSEGYYK